MDSFPEIPIHYTKVRKGEIIPIPQDMFLEMLASIPNHYLQKIKGIEWRQHMNNSPILGAYRSQARTIIFYYIDYPLFVTLKDSEFIESLRFHKARFETVNTKPHTSMVSFPSYAHLALWYFHYVVCHELAHHYVSTLNKYRKKRIDTKTDEKRTNMLATRIYNEFVENIHSKEQK